LIGAEQAGLNLISHEAAANAEGESAVQIRLKPLPPRLSAEEEAAHTAFVASLGQKAIWLRYSPPATELAQSAA
jgi:DNA polymerase-3 subunit epsilon